jgi:hypothetical protein
MMIKKYLVMVTFLLAGTVVKAQAPADDANYTR